MSDRLSYVSCIGSNTPDRALKIDRAIAALSAVCDIVMKSQVYEAPDESGIGAPYLNCVIEISPLLSHDRFCSELKRIERDFGRDATSKSTGVMPLDLDIIIWNGEIVDRYQYSRDYFLRGFDDLRRLV